MRAVVAEGLGTALLVAIVVGSGIMAERLAGGNVAIALLANTLATGAGLLALLLAFGPISGAHFNPVVTVLDAAAGRRSMLGAGAYVAAQLAGGLAGTWAAHAMFALPILQVSHHVRAGAAQLFSEGVATFGLVAVIAACSRRRPGATPFAVAAYIVAAYWFTASTSFANPAVTLARAATDTFAGIRPSDVPGFVIAQFVGGASAALLFGWLVPDPAAGASATDREPKTELPAFAVSDDPAAEE